MKKAFYITVFVVLGIELQFLVHAFVEIWYIKLLVRDFPTYGLGFSWQQWFIIHHVASAMLLIAGVTLGFWQGNYWWRRIYENRLTEVKSS